MNRRNKALGETSSTKRQFRRCRVLFEELGLIVFLGGILAFGSFLLMGSFGASEQQKNPGNPASLRVAQAQVSGKAGTGAISSRPDIAAASAPEAMAAAENTSSGIATMPKNQANASDTTVSTAADSISSGVPTQGTSQQPQPSTRQVGSTAGSETSQARHSETVVQTRTKTGNKSGTDHTAVDSAKRSRQAPPDHKTNPEATTNVGASAVDASTAAAASSARTAAQTAKRSAAHNDDPAEHGASASAREAQTDRARPTPANSDDSADSSVQTPKPTQPEPQAPSIEVLDATFAYNMVRRQPQGRVTYIDYSKTMNGRLYYYIRVNAARPTSLVHEWRHEGHVVKRVRFEVAGKDTVSVSHHAIPENKKGVWRVYVRNTTGKVIKIGTSLYP